jgi:hypothetical protein
MGDGQMPKQLLYIKVGGKRYIGRPRAKWLDEVSATRKISIKLFFVRAFSIVCSLKSRRFADWFCLRLQVRGTYSVESLR